MKHPLAHRVLKPTRYVPSTHSDIRKTFDRARKELRDQRIVIVTVPTTPRKEPK